ncbi:DUF2164 domain-containing protein [Roseibium salinum]|uniref:DUF2164 domain-containing protein n=1 Tax=Roseibium salinum TaxID=1604349 RepID=A0ABT3QYW1_9HYPH|nr:DUF2164 domain-containing protein [Roseibium sp. DSM 29163]MCX2722134.1 DUF2164 domain-containing protein [Roseibium sp. DSM 29163]
MTDLELDKDTRIRLALQIQRFMAEDLDVEIGNMDAEKLIEYLTSTLGAQFYNQGLKEAQALFARKSEEITYAVYELEVPEDPIR